MSGTHLPPPSAGPHLTGRFLPAHTCKIHTCRAHTCCSQHLPGLSAAAPELPAGALCFRMSLEEVCSAPWSTQPGGQSQGLATPHIVELKGAGQG